MSTTQTIRWPGHPGRGPHSAEHKRKLDLFADDMRRVDEELDFDMSTRGWAYYLEGEGHIEKDNIEYATGVINDLRKEGTLPMDITARDDSRLFTCGGGLDAPRAVDKYIKDYMYTITNATTYSPAFWETQNYYLMVIVEKVDLRELFSQICKEYYIPIANTRGWSSMNQRAEIIRRCYYAERRGQQPVLLYCGDYDPEGVHISDTLTTNIRDLDNARISDGEGGYITDYVPETLIVDRFGLNREIIDAWDLQWVDNLKTGGGGDLASPSHKDHDKEYVQTWLDEVGERKVEANALLKDADAALELFHDVVTKYLGDNPKESYQQEEKEMRMAVRERLDELNISTAYEISKPHLDY